MKIPQLIALFILSVVLLGGTFKAAADEKLTIGQTSLGGTTISGYSNSTTGSDFQPPVTRQDNWWWEFMAWFGFHHR